MRLSHFFIDRPIFAGVLSLLITILGAFAYFTLAVAQYPEVAPPTLQVTATYPGASADVVSETVATPVDGRWETYADAELQTRDRPQHGSCVNANPRARRPATSSTNRPAAGRHRQEGCERLCNRSASLLAGRIARSALSLELCNVAYQGRDLPFRWCGRRPDVRCA